MTTDEHDSEIIPLDRDHFFDMIETSFNEGLFGTGARKENENGNIVIKGSYGHGFHLEQFDEFVISKQDNTIIIREQDVYTLEDTYIYDLKTCKTTHIDFSDVYVPCRLEDEGTGMYKYALVLCDLSTPVQNGTFTITLFNGERILRGDDDGYNMVLLSKEFSDSLPPK